MKNAKTISPNTPSAALQPRGITITGIPKPVAQDVSYAIPSDPKGQELTGSCQPVSPMRTGPEDPEPVKETE